jgi:CcmD family protein
MIQGFFTSCWFLFQADFFRSMGKIYTVVAVTFVIWIGIVIYLFRLEKKIKKLEDQMK